SGRFVPDAHGAQSACDDCTVDAITVPDDVARSLIPGECLGDLSASDENPRWRSPEASHGLDTGFENGFAADAHGCIMVRFVMDLPDTRLRREFLVPDSELPSDASSRPQQACRRARVYQGAAWKRWRVRTAQSDGRP